jgi:hypothetical protein
VDSLPNGITGVVSAGVTNDATATPRATLTHGLASTSDGSASVPGCAMHCMEAAAQTLASLSF